MPHILNWSPGNTGKGIIEPNGRVHTWNTNEYEEPHHFDYLMYKGLPDTDSKFFEITPEGYYDSWDKDVKGKLDAIPHLKSELDDWNLSKVATVPKWDPKTNFFDFAHQQIP